MCMGSVCVCVRVRVKGNTAALALVDRISFCQSVVGCGILMFTIQPT